MTPRIKPTSQIDNLRIFQNIRALRNWKYKFYLLAETSYLT